MPIAAGMTKQIQTDMRGIIIFMLFMEAAACALSTGFAMLLIFIDSHERPAEMNGIRNRPSAGPQTEGSLQSVWEKKFHSGCWPRLTPRKVKSIFIRPSIFPASADCTSSQWVWVISASVIST